MITLKQAVQKLQSKIQNTNMRIFNICDDLEEYWVFDWRYKSSPEKFTSGDVFKVYKETGKIEFVYIGLPGDSFFEELFANKNKIDISNYLENE